MQINRIEMMMLLQYKEEAHGYKNKCQLSIAIYYPEEVKSRMFAANIN